MKEKIVLKSEWPLLIVLTGFHILNILFAVFSGFYEILGIQFTALIFQAAVTAGIIIAGKKIKTSDIDV